MANVINVDSAAVRAYADRLRQMNRSALPVVVRKTLDDAAFDMKLRTMPKESDVFVHRRPTFFKANSRAEKAQGFDINAMKSQFYFKPKQSDTSHSVEDLEQQDKGGAIKGRSFIALRKARIANSWQKVTQTAKRLEKVRATMINAPDAPDYDKHGRKRSDKEKFILSAIHLKKNSPNSLLIGTTRTGKGNRHVHQIHSVHRMTKTVTSRSGKTVNRGDTVVNFSEPLFAVKGHRSIHPKATKFSQKAATQSWNKMEAFFMINAQKKLQ